MAPVLSKDTADIEVPTARWLSGGGWGAQMVGALKAPGPPPRPGKSGSQGNLASAGGLRGGGTARSPRGRGPGGEVP